MGWDESPVEFPKEMLLSVFRHCQGRFISILSRGHLSLITTGQEEKTEGSQQRPNGTSPTGKKNATHLCIKCHRLRFPLTPP